MNETPNQRWHHKGWPWDPSDMRPPTSKEQEIAAEVADFASELFGSIQDEQGDWRWSSDEVVIALVQAILDESAAIGDDLPDDIRQKVLAVERLLETAMAVVGDDVRVLLEAAARLVNDLGTRAGASTHGGGATTGDER